MRLASPVALAARGSTRSAYATGEPGVEILAPGGVAGSLLKVRVT